MNRPSSSVARASLAPVSDEEAYHLAELGGDVLCAAARERRDRAWGKKLTFSPKVFLPVESTAMLGSLGAIRELWAELGSTSEADAE